MSEHEHTPEYLALLDKGADVANEFIGSLKRRKIPPDVALYGAAFLFNAALIKHESENDCVDALANVVQSVMKMRPTLLAALQKAAEPEAKA